MPRIAAPTNAAQRAQTQRKILNAFGELLFTHGLPGLTMTDVARTAGVGRTAVYNYFADLEQLLVAYALDETGKFVIELKSQLDGLENPVDRLAVYVRAQLADLTRRHLPPGPAMRSVLSSESFEKLGVHVGELNTLLMDILQDGMDQQYLPPADVDGLVQLIHGSLTASASRRNADTPDEERIEAAVRFIQAGVGASFDGEGHPVKLA
ncbi:AcrR family transcriptional regulator [Arthrobacter stackebrandtii]|uniref:AcrR family transcriptional regulator n=1 Tax=Arthrobacter stackebrandtii TaxID=272161 RepID=A0ABS4YW55_9MICC|nr:TetR/AcrR family transcriptional regulator [Arthrobacter stackebrandtii]MBP2413033.1 AcrR family transcriptional regulator [Arthrobacter stackebrandtii]PYH01186.1 TetR/AcrR family transcriptional regulator [Arthrobacter stackebrandtii]